MLGEYLENVHQNSPLIHCITNYVTVNDVANVLLASGASPIMSAEPRDVEEITSICSGLYINIGTLTKRGVRGMNIAGGAAERLGHPMVLDPVGAGASAYRTKTALELMDSLHFHVIKGNVSEIRTLADGSGSTRGVDASAADVVTEDNLNVMVKFAKDFAKAKNCIVAITGKIDLVADAERCFVIRNGKKEMGKVTGTGCQLGALINAFICSNPRNMLGATAAAVCAMGVAGEIGWSRMEDGEGNATYRNRIIDAVYNMTGAMLNKCARYEIC